MKKGELRRIAECAKVVRYQNTEYYAQVTRTTDSVVTLKINLDMQEKIRNEIRLIEMEKELEVIDQRLNDTAIPHDEWVRLSNRRSLLCIKLNKGKAVCEDFNGIGVIARNCSNNR